MLDAYIIDEIKKKEQEKRERDRPRLYIQIDDRPIRRDMPKKEDYKIDYNIDNSYDERSNDDEDGKIVINMFDSYKL